MSALTDLFTAMANKIRSKTGTATTYTPLEMVSDGIDDVYDAGYAAGGGGGGTATPITPSNSSPASMTSGTTYEAMGTGYAIESYSSVTPSNSNAPGLTSGSIYKMGGGGRAVAGITEITPSDLTLVPLQTSGIYKPLVPGVAIATNPQTVTPSSSAQTLSSGIIYKMNGTGYVYSSQPNKTETTLWTNSAPTSNFSGQNVTLSQGISNFDYIKVYFRQSTSVDTTTSIIFDKTDIMTNGDTYPRLGAAMYIKTSSSANPSVRGIRYVSNTSLNISVAVYTGVSGGANSAMIPTKITGIKYNGISL